MKIPSISIQSQRGFMLLEAVIAVAIIGFGSVALTKMQSTVFVNSSIAKQQSEATHLAQKKIEELRNFTTIDTYNNITNSTDTVTAKNTQYTVSWSTTTYTDPNYKKINVNVAWLSRTNESRSISLSSIIHQAQTLDAIKVLTEAPPGSSPVPST